jgi:uncharacterized protein (TIGR00251 family)
VPYAATPPGLTLRVKVTPKAAADRVTGTVIDADGAPWLKVAVTAPADRGRANAAVIRLLAERLDVPRSAIRLAQGETSRQKTIVISGDAAALAARLEALLLPTPPSVPAP